ncbi:hypothetical protein [Paenibacillus sp. S150]|uniref:exo-rhamnogalacturonan lyase family protein n=1 Tax=Paenibacillus sp. S150 TaxID=2749826 RepID=UPI001E3983C2|nr:hypothetical protein [Paenibacillus sp. S150]
MSTDLPITLHWLQKPAVPAGVTWGVPWSKGRLSRSALDTLCLDAPGSAQPVPLQSRAAAFWPDGSVKWSTHSAVFTAADDSQYELKQLQHGQPHYGQLQHGQPQYGQLQHGQPQHGQPQYGQSQHGQHGQQQYGQQQYKQPQHGLKQSPVSSDVGGGAAVSVSETDDAFIVDTGAIVCTVNKSGAGLIRSIVRVGAAEADIKGEAGSEAGTSAGAGASSSDPGVRRALKELEAAGGIELCSGGELICIRECRGAVSGMLTVREERFTGRTLRAVLEQDGPVRAVVKLEGRHRSAAGTREWIPYTLRLYFHAGLESIRLVHTFHYDGNPHEDYIKGLGIAFTVPLRGAQYNRHVRFAGDSGWFSESPKLLHTRRTKGKYRDLFTEQTEGHAVAFDQAEDACFLGLLEDSAVWDSFRLVQDSADHYVIRKRTGEDCAWIKSAEGRRAGGLGYVGSEGGGLAAGMKDFWRKHPSGLETGGTSGGAAVLTVWFWSPDAAAMDLRHYDTRTHVESAYEGAEELRATPYGIANTSELTLWCTSQTPGMELLDRMREEASAPSLLVCEPAYYHAAGAFGYWSLPDSSTPVKARLEERLDGIIAFYQEEIEQRKWYGFWDYGDFMHSYDPVRHVWNYDLGGCAWQNSELVPNMWLWVTFLRSGRADVFRMAEAMTRHTSEVDVYHFGEYAGLGSRHNVVHWGCGCKEARIAMAGLHRYYYYLTGDERTGDIMDSVRDADYSTVALDPMRAYFPKDEFPTHVRVGPDWAAFSSNWMTRWERFGDTAYRDKILTGIGCIKSANLRLLSGPTYGYDPKTGILTGMGDDNWGRHLAISMGGPQVWFELAAMLEDPEWEDMLAEFGVFYNLPEEEQHKLSGGAITGKLRFEHPVLSVAIAAFGAYYRKDPVTAERCWAILLGNPFGRVNLREEAERVTYVGELNEIDWMNTNEASQWSLNTIISLELIGTAEQVR